MQVCSCKSFNCAATKEAIATHKPNHAEEIHQIIRQEPPNCGRCLATVEALMARQESDGVVPDVLDLTPADYEQASQTLKERFEAEIKALPKDQKPPSYMRYYTQGNNPLKIK